MLSKKHSKECFFKILKISLTIGVYLVIVDAKESSSSMSLVFTMAPGYRDLYKYSYISFGGKYKNSQIKGGNGNSAKKGPATEFGVFVGNISYKCTENDLKKFFKDCGKIAEVRIAKRDDGKLKGFAHVDFETKEGMENASNQKEFIYRNGKILNSLNTDIFSLVDNKLVR